MSFYDLAECHKGDFSLIFWPFKLTPLNNLIMLVMRKYLIIIALSIVAAAQLSSCSQVQGTQAAPPPQSLPVVAVNAAPATTYLEYSATVEGTTNVEIRPQVSG